MLLETTIIWELALLHKKYLIFYLSTEQCLYFIEFNNKIELSAEFLLQHMLFFLMNSLFHGKNLPASTLLCPWIKLKGISNFSRIQRRTCVKLLAMTKSPSNQTGRKFFLSICSLTGFQKLISKANVQAKKWKKFIKLNLTKRRLECKLMKTRFVFSKLQNPILFVSSKSLIIWSFPFF